MKNISYFGTDGDTITIERATDLYPALDWIQNKMIELQEGCYDYIKETDNSTDNPIIKARRETAKQKTKELERVIHFISELMDKTENAGFGSIDDVGKIKY